MNKKTKLNSPTLWLNKNKSVIRIVYPTGKVEYFHLDDGSDTRWRESSYSRGNRHDWSKGHNAKVLHRSALFNVAYGHTFLGVI